MALRSMLLGRNLLQKAAPATGAARSFFRSAAASTNGMPKTEEEITEYLADKEEMTLDQVNAKFLADFPVEPVKSSGPDIVKEVFYDVQRKFRAFSEKTKELTIPSDGDEDAIAEYAAKRNAILKELGIRTPEENIEDTLNVGMSSNMSAKDYLAYAAQQRTAMGIDDAGGLGKALEAALAEQEKASGETLMVNDSDGMIALYDKVEDIVAGLGLEGDVATASSVEEATYEMGQIKAELEKLA